MVFSSSARLLVTISFAVCVLLAKQSAVVHAQEEAANTTVSTPVLDCAAGTANIYSGATLTNALEDAIEGVIALKDPLQCTASGDKVKCSYDFGTQDSNFEEVCTSNSVNGNLVDTSFDISCNYDGSMGGVTYTFAQAPLCVATNCDDSKYYDSLTITTDAMATYMNNITGIKDCTAEISAGTKRMSNNSAVLVTFIGSAVFVAMTVLF